MNGNKKIASRELEEMLLNQVVVLGGQLIEQLPEKFIQEYITVNRRFLKGEMDAQAMTVLTMEELKVKKKAAKFFIRQFVRLLAFRQEHLKRVYELQEAANQNGRLKQ